MLFINKRIFCVPCFVRFLLTFKMRELFLPHPVVPILILPYRCALFDLRFSHRFCWGLRCSGMWCFVIPNILKIMGPPSWTFENEGTMIHEISWTAYVNDSATCQLTWILSNAAARTLHSVTFVYMQLNVATVLSGLSSQECTKLPLLLTDLCGFVAILQGRIWWPCFCSLDGCTRWMRVYAILLKALY